MEKLVNFKYTLGDKVERLRIMREVGPLWRDMGA